MKNQVAEYFVFKDEVISRLCVAMITGEQLITNPHAANPWIYSGYFLDDCRQAVTFEYVESGAKGRLHYARYRFKTTCKVEKHSITLDYSAVIEVVGKFNELGKFIMLDVIDCKEY